MVLFTPDQASQTRFLWVIFPMVVPQGSLEDESRHDHMINKSHLASFLRDRNLCGWTFAWPRCDRIAVMQNRKQPSGSSRENRVDDGALHNARINYKAQK